MVLRLSPGTVVTSISQASHTDQNVTIKDGRVLIILSFHRVTRLIRSYDSATQVELMV
jgi:hypothetical protein